MLNGSLRLLSALLLFGLVAVVHAEECLVSTSPPPIVKAYPGVTDTSAQLEAGLYTASIDNGNQILVQFGTCGLMVRGHYLIREALPLSDLKQVLTRFVTALVPAPTDAESIRKQIDAIASLEPGQIILLKGAADEHEVRFDQAPSSLFAQVIHYQWLPPQH